MILTIQHLIIHFFFLQEVNGTQVVALNNRYFIEIFVFIYFIKYPYNKTFRHFFFNFQYYMVFINMAVGLVACLMRMLISLFLGLWILPRLDMSTLNRAFERLDNGIVETKIIIWLSSSSFIYIPLGFSSYVCMLIVQHTQTNPVMVVFVNILLRCQLPTKSSDSAVFKSFDTLNTNSSKRQEFSHFQHYDLFWIFRLFSIYIQRRSHDLQSKSIKDKKEPLVSLYNTS